MESIIYNLFPGFLLNGQRVRSGSHPTLASVGRLRNTARIYESMAGCHKVSPQYGDQRPSPHGDAHNRAHHYLGPFGEDKERQDIRRHS